MTPPNALRALAAGLCLLPWAPARAIEFSADVGSGVTGVLNTTVVAGAAVRMHDPSVDLIGKGDLNRDICVGQFQACQGTFRDQIFPSQRLSRVPGQFTLNADDGNLNYGKGNLTSALVKVTQDLSVKYGDFGVFARGLYFYDHVNETLTENHPNRVVVGNVNSPDVGMRAPLGPAPNLAVTQPYQVRRGQQVDSRRQDSETLKQIGSNYQLLDAYFFGKAKLPFTDTDLTFKLGRQTVNWGQSTTLVINSINQANPVNANNFNRIGFALEEVFTPIAMAYASAEPFKGATVEGFYQFEWLPVEAPTPGSYLSTLDIGTRNTGSFLTTSFGGGFDDPDSVGRLQANPLSGLTYTTTTSRRLPDNKAKTEGQYGAAFKYYAEGLGNGTELGFYFMNYHSRLPYGSVYAAQASCARREGNARRNDATSTAEFGLDCPNITLFADNNPLLRPGNIQQDPATTRFFFTNPDGDSPRAQGSDALAIDTVRFQLEYPENIKLYGISFATTAGDWSFQGEVAYRPNLPLQVDTTDLFFAALGPTATRCHDRNLQRTAVAETPVVVGGVTLITVPAFAAGQGCTGSTIGVGNNEAGGMQQYMSSDFIPGPGVTGYRDTFDLAVGHAPGSARAFPSFVTAYRGGTVGENAPTDLSKPYDKNNPGYIQGYERFQVYQFNFGGTRVYGATDNPISADQVLFVFETGATYVPNLPDLDQLQIASPGVFTHASAGADGSGADGSRQACSTNPSCSIGPDGLRFNPHQADRSMYVTKLSYGVRAVAILKYESVLPGISVQPFILAGWDIRGIAPGPGENFIEGRKSVALNIETRYKSAFSVTAGYNWFWGGGPSNLVRDRDYAQVFLKYLF